MRAGAFTDRRIIRLIKRRFVPFYFNTGGPGAGKDPKAYQFVMETTKGTRQNGLIVDPNGRMSNTIAYFAAFSPSERTTNSTLLGLANGWQSEEESYDLEKLYPSTDAIFRFLLDLLKHNPNFNQWSTNEKKLLARVAIEKPRVKDLLKVAVLYEDLGMYTEAIKAFKRTCELAAEKKELYLKSCLGQLRIFRYQNDWNKHRKFRSKLERMLTANRIIGDHLILERVFDLLNQKSYLKSLQYLEKGIKDFPDSNLISQMRYYAGVSAFFLKKGDIAFYHWCWIVENLQEDRLYRRAYIAAVHKIFPYPNYDLGGYRSKESVSNDDIKRAYIEAKKSYLKIKKNRHDSGVGIENYEELNEQATEISHQRELFLFCIVPCCLFIY